VHVFFQIALETILLPIQNLKYDSRRELPGTRSDNEFAKSHMENEYLEHSFPQFEFPVISEPLRRLVISLRTEFAKSRIENENIKLGNLLVCSYIHQDSVYVKQHRNSLIKI
jgi:hypothetical protein